MCELGILNEGYGRIIFSSLLSFLPSGMMLPLSLITVLSAPLTTYSLWNNLLLIFWHTQDENQKRPARAVPRRAGMLRRCVKRIALAVPVCEL